MSSRRPRIKPVANLMGRRVKTDNPIDNKSKIDLQPDNDRKEEKVNKFKENDVETVIPVVNSIVAENNKTDEIQNSNDEINNIEKSISQLQSQGQSTAEIKTNRRRIKPTITLPQRKPKVSTVSAAKDDEIKETTKCTKETEPVESEEILAKEPITVDNYDIINPPSNESGKISNFEEPIDDSVFKSPQNFLSPRYNPPTPKTNPFGNEITSIMHSNNDISPKDEIRCPLSPTKIRQRIKAVPMLGNRRNSVQGRDECDEVPRRQRHLSSSSSHSNQNLSFNYKTIGSPVYPYSNRVRTESSCSNASDISVVRETTVQKIRRGNRSEEHHRLNEAKRGFRERFQNSVPDKSQLKMYDMIFYNPSSNPMKNAIAIKEDRRGSSGASSISSFVGKRDPSIPSPTLPLPVKSKNEENAMPVPQLKIGPNGDIIIDEKSLVIETTSEKTARETLANSDIVYDDEFSGTQGFYKRQMRMRDWGRAETIKFYRCLQTIGTDFSMMIQLFPKRNRRELKLKFKKEEKINPGLINKALLCPKTFNIDELEQDFKHDEEIERLAAEKLQQKRIQDRKEIMSISKPNPSQKRNYKSRTFQCLQKGDFIYENENLLNKNIVKHRRTHSKIYESHGEDNALKQSSKKRLKLIEQNLSLDNKIIEDSSPNAECELELNNNNDENMYTPNLNILENNYQHVVPSTGSDMMEYDNSSAVLSNGNGFTTLVNNCGKSYFSSDMTTNPSPTSEKIIEFTPEPTDEPSHSSFTEAMDDSDGECLVIDTEYTELDEEMNVKQSNNKTDMLINRIPSKSITNNPNDISERDSEYLNRLVSVEIEDTKDANNKQYQFFTIDPETGNLSERPLDLPSDIVETIITKCCKK